jgi:hypothetical protein
MTFPDAHTTRCLAAEAEADPRTIRRALMDGVDAIRVSATRERVRRVLAAHGLKPERHDSSAPPAGGE